MARRLCTGLSANPRVGWVRASDLTGNVTIEFDRAFGLKEICALIRAVLTIRSIVNRSGTSRKGK